MAIVPVPGQQPIGQLPGNRKVICSGSGRSTHIHLPFQCPKKCLATRVIVYTHWPETSPLTQEPIATWAGRSAQRYEYHQLTHYQRCLFIFFETSRPPHPAKNRWMSPFWENSAPGSAAVMVGTRIIHRSLATPAHISHNR